MAQTNVRELFDLKPTEQIFDDFSCKEGALSSGRMYITENYLCFFRSMIGFSKKIKIMWTDITSIEVKSSSIRIIATTEKEPISFQGFSDFQTSSKYIQKLWQAARGADSDEQSEAENDSQNRSMKEEQKSLSGSVLTVDPVPPRKLSDDDRKVMP